MPLRTTEKKTTNTFYMFPRANKRDAGVMKSTETHRGTIKGWSELSTPLGSLLSSPSVCVWVCVVSDDTEAVASRRHCRWQIWKKKRTRNGRITDREKPRPVRTNGKGHKLWQCSNVPSGELHSPLFDFLLARQLTKRPFVSLKVVHKQEILNCLTQSLYAWEKLSVIWQHLQSSPPPECLCWTGLCKTFAQYEWNSSRG